MIIRLPKHCLNKNDFLSVIDGMEQDSALEVRIRNWESLENYMDLVSCSVGRLSNPIFGIRGDENEKLAESLGQALQLTNILRDLFEDASNNRLYVPRDMIREQGIFSKIPSNKMCICFAIANGHITTLIDTKYRNICLR